jgi:hypothetical protein
MESPDQNLKKHSIKEVMLFESKITELLQAIAAKLSRYVKSTQFMRDNNFIRREDRTTNDIHLFLELKNGKYFHLRSYTRHMLDMNTIPTDEIFLTGYVKESISQNGGEHSFKQGWYQWNPDTIANEIIIQNPELFK